jgi:hypothetical protein
MGVFDKAPDKTSITYFVKNAYNTGLVKIMLTLKLVGLVIQIVLHTSDGLQLGNHTLPSSKQPLFFTPMLTCLYAGEK